MLASYCPMYDVQRRRKSWRLHIKILIVTHIKIPIVAQFMCLSRFFFSHGNRKLQFGSFVDIGSRTLKLKSPSNWPSHWTNGFFYWQKYLSLIYVFSLCPFFLSCANSLSLLPNCMPRAQDN